MAITARDGQTSGARTRRSSSTFPSTALPVMASAARAAQTPAGPAPELLWPNGAPGALGTADEDKPSITPYLAKSPNGTAVIVCPGGGYQNLAMDHEGVQIAKWLNSLGISAFVLKYRLGPRYRHPAMIDDAVLLPHRLP